MSPKTDETGLAEFLDKLEKETPLPELPAPDTQEKMRDEKDLKLDRYLLKFKDRIEAWKQSHPEQVPPPIFYDSDYQDWVWLNRDQRRQR